MPRFVVLRHDSPPDSARGLHWDFMLEAGDVLHTWALADEPPTTCFAERLPDHRRLYLDYEGEVSGVRGAVSRWDTGDYVATRADDDTIVVELHGARLGGTATLVRMSGQAQRWRFSFEPAGTAASSTA